ncbi:hypothetical protein EB001_13920 [bacterium]|nr:hypothetical protein [bacterium]
MADLTLRSIKGSPLTITEVDDNFTALNTDVGTRLLSSSYTAADVLTKIKTVDGTGSGLDADLLDGLSSSSANTNSTIVARDSSGNFAAAQITATTFVGSLVVPTTGSVSLSGSSSGTITLVAPSSAGTNTITFPASTGTVITNADVATVTNSMLAGSINNAKLANSTITIDGNAVALGGSVSISSGNITWTGSQTFRDNKWTMTDNSDNTKAFIFEAGNITSNTTRTMTIPNSDGTIALQSYVQSYVQTTGQNSQGTKTISSSTPTGGSAGDVWYQI